jgi:hypothetical protein
MFWKESEKHPRNFAAQRLVFAHRDDLPLRRNRYNPQYQATSNLFGGAGASGDLVFAFLGAGLAIRPLLPASRLLKTAVISSMRAE